MPTGLYTNKQKFFSPYNKEENIQMRFVYFFKLFRNKKQTNSNKTKKNARTCRQQTEPKEQINRQINKQMNKQTNKQTNEQSQPAAPSAL